MLKCRQIVTHFNSSSQATQLLISKQYNLSQAVGLIQDVTTRWWSTFMMLARLIRLRPYLQLLFTEKKVPSDLHLNPDEWIIVEDTKRILEPFMIAQRLLEGEKYVTVSLILIIITTIRKGLTFERDRVENSHHVKELSAILLQDFNKHWGSGLEGTIWQENLILGERNRPKGITQAALMATYLDPRTKSMRGLGEIDKAFVRNAIKEKLISMGNFDQVFFVLLQILLMIFS